MTARLRSIEKASGVGVAGSFCTRVVGRYKLPVVVKTFELSLEHTSGSCIIVAWLYRRDRMFLIRV